MLLRNHIPAGCLRHRTARFAFLLQLLLHASGR